MTDQPDQDTFTRTVASGWGAAESGLPELTADHHQIMRMLRANDAGANVNGMNAVAVVGCGFRNPQWQVNAGTNTIGRMLNELHVLGLAHSYRNPQSRSRSRRYRLTEKGLSTIKEIDGHAPVRPSEPPAR